MKTLFNLVFLVMTLISLTACSSTKILTQDKGQISIKADDIDDIADAKEQADKFCLGGSKLNRTEEIRGDIIAYFDCL